PYTRHDISNNLALRRTYESYKPVIDTPLYCCIVIYFQLRADSRFGPELVPEQLFPINKRVSETEASMTQMGGRVSNVEGQVQKMSSQIAELDSRLKQSDAKAERALENLQRLKLDRRLVLDFKQGAFFASNSTVLTDQAKKEIDSFLSDLRGDADGMGNVLLVVAGHTDNTGTVKYNYELAKIRAENA